MMRMTDRQALTLAETARQKFRRRSIALMRRAEPKLCEGRDDAVIGAYVDRVIAFADRHGIAREDNIQRLMLLDARHRFVGDPDPYLSYVLGRAGFGEAYRIAEFRRVLRQPQPRVRITLDTDLGGYP